MSNVFNFSSSSSIPPTSPVQVEYPKTSNAQNTPNVIIVNGAIVTGDWEINPYGTTRNMASKIKALEKQLAEVMSQNGLFTRNAEVDEAELFIELDRQFYSLSVSGKKSISKLDFSRPTIVDVISLENDEE